MHDNEMTYYKDITNPVYVGPGTWNVIHTIAMHANTLEKQKEAIKTITFICNTFPCEVCRGHAQEYIKANPLEDYLMKKSQPLSIFFWTWKFHNAVNYKIGKHVMSKDVAIKLYSPTKDTKLCSKECSGDGKKKKKHTKTKELKEGTLYLKSKKK